MKTNRRLPAIRVGVGDATGAISPEDNDTDASDLNDSSELPQAEAADQAAGSITMPWYQSLYQTVLQATGQLNSSGTGAGNGFWSSPAAIALYAVGGVLTIGYLLDSPVLAAAIASKGEKS